MKTYNNTAGTTSNQFTLGQGSGAEVRHFVLTASTTASNEFAVTRDGSDIDLNGVEFYDIKVLAKNGSGIVARHLRGTITGSTITRIEDVFQEDFGADVVLTSVNSILKIACTPDGVTQTDYTIYVVLTRVSV
jgi:hypothetical protein